MKKNKIIYIILSLILVGLVVFLDQWSKFAASHNEKLLQGEKIIFMKHILSFYLAFNKGAAWSMLTGKKLLLCGMSVIASLVVTAFLVKICDFKKNWFLTVTLIFIDGGAIGNLIDRMFYEKGVIDFLCFEFIDFPIFNVADSFLTVGAICLIIYCVFIDRSFFFDTKELKQKEKKEENNLC